MTTEPSLEVIAVTEDQEYVVQVIVEVIEEGKDYRDKQFNTIVMTAKAIFVALGIMSGFSLIPGH